MSERYIRVRGTGTAKEKPDIVVIRFGVTAHEWEYEDSVDRLNEKISGLRDKLEKAGIKRDKLKTTSFDVRTDYIWKKKKVKGEETKEKEFNGYIANHSVRLTLGLDKKLLGKVLKAIAESEVDADFSLHFEIKDKQAFREKLLQSAVSNGRSSAQIIAESAGVELGELMTVDYSWQEMRFRSPLMIEESGVMGSVAAESEASFSPEDIEESDSVTMVWRIR